MPDFDAFARDLTRAGVAPQHVRRSELELREHYQDLIDDRLAAGYSEAAAIEWAERQLGQLDDIATDIAARPELLSWAHRWPHAALVVYPLACAAVLPAMPIVGAIQHAHAVRRWAACLMGGAAVTASMLLILQLAITLT